MDNAATLEEYDKDAERVTKAIALLEGIRSNIWKKRDALFCKIERGELR